MCSFRCTSLQEVPSFIAVWWGYFAKFWSIFQNVGMRAQGFILSNRCPPSNIRVELEHFFISEQFEVDVSSPPGTEAGDFRSNLL
jgi:hypothetical protein